MGMKCFKSLDFHVILNRLNYPEFGGNNNKEVS
jgi:hypothetical protein